MAEIIDNQIVLTCPRCHNEDDTEYGIAKSECSLCGGAGKVALGGQTADSQDIPDNEAAKIEYI